MKSAPDSSSTPSSNRRKRPKLGGSSKRLDFDENSSSSSWVEYERLQIGEVARNFKLFPMDDNLEVRLVMDFLVGVATLQEFSTLFLESHVLILCFDYLDARKKLNSRILGQVVHVSCSRKYALQKHFFNEGRFAVAGESVGVPSIRNKVSGISYTSQSAH